MGFEPHQEPSTDASVNRFAERMLAAEEEAKAALTKAKDEQARYYNRRRTPTPVFKPGDKVWLDSSDIRTDQPSKKLSHLWWGPYKVERAVGTHAYRLRLPPTMHRLHPVFPVVKLERAEPDPITGRAPAPPPDPVVIDGNLEYEVEAILDSRYRYRRLEYKVRWKGYGPEDDTWEPAKNLGGAQRHVNDFHSRHPAAVRRLSAPAFDSLAFRPRVEAPRSWWGGDVRGTPVPPGFTAASPCLASFPRAVPSSVLSARPLHGPYQPCAVPAPLYGPVGYSQSS